MKQLSSKSFSSFLKKAKTKGYEITLLFFWLNSHELAIDRVKTRVEEGGHNIPTEIILRRYDRGLVNFFNMYKSIVDNWMFIDNSGEPYNEIARSDRQKITVNNKDKWNLIKSKYEK